MSSQKPKASTQEHLDVDNIVDDLVLLKGGNVAMIMLTNAINFDILSESEQDATIYAYAALLNSLSFPVEILIRSKRADISAYFQNLETAFESQPNPDLKAQIKKYMEFIQSTVQQKTVLDKKFYLIISFSPLEMGLKNFGKSASKTKSKALLVSDAKINLIPKRDHLTKQTARLGLLTRQLTTKELIELFYDIYNPAPTGTQKVVLDNGNLSLLVQPAVEVPQAAPLQTDQPAQKMPQEPLPAGIPTGQPMHQEALNNLQTASGQVRQFIENAKGTNQIIQPVNQTINNKP